MKSTELLQPILEGGVRSINFFNGRLLTGEDLTAEQAASREWLGRLGKLLGGGVAGGLTVSPSPVAGKPAVIVDAGLAMNALGQALRLTSAIEVSLLRPDGAPDDAAAPPPPTKDFGDCQPRETGIYRTGDGVYLLTLAPAGGAEGSVPTNGLGNLTATCATRFLVDAVKFRLISLSSAFTNEQLLGPKLRNLVAAKCFGVASSRALVTDPFGAPPASTKLLDTLGKKLPACDVPLAVLHWTAEGGVEFIDHWCVRRRLAGPPDELVWSPALGERSIAESEAMMLQFQDQIDALATSGVTRETFVATTAFDYLPAAGVIPLAGTAGFRGFLPDQLFKGLKARDPIFIEGARVASLLRRGRCFPPMDLASGEMLWVYHVRENAMKADGLSGTTVQPYAIFVSGQVPYDGGAVFDIAHWDYASFA
ncbi:hypothetical protein [Sorangium sp. So ce887]|uniref:hypothetical protein n=1 Tax=Sorangium sp. So ce887 TaxID=3133324 RepID=UPI003F5E8CFB